MNGDEINLTEYQAPRVAQHIINKINAKNLSRSSCTEEYRMVYARNKNKGINKSAADPKKKSNMSMHAELI
jgi:hypothetical protein